MRKEYIQLFTIATTMRPTTPVDISSLFKTILGDWAPGETPDVASPKVTILFSVPQGSDFAIVGHAELKGFIHELHTRLNDSKIRTDDRIAILKRLDSLLADQNLWKHRSESYGIFVSPEMARF